MSNEMSRRSSLMAAGVAFVKSNGPLMACILIVAPVGDRMGYTVLLLLLSHLVDHWPFASR